MLSLHFLFALVLCLEQTANSSPVKLPFQNGKLSSSSASYREKVWLGWAQTRKMYIFGDSYTTTYFDNVGKQPNENRPLGNPPYPGVTSSNGPNWVDYLTTKYNRSMMETYNMAVGGATIDADLIPPTVTAVDFFHQVTKKWMPFYGSMSTGEWTPSDTLFAMFFGINDVNNSYKMGVSSLNQDALKIYRGLIDALYAAGARNFIFLSVPPIQRSPLTTGQGEVAVVLQRNAVVDFNKGLEAMVADFNATHPGTTTFQLNTYDLFMQVLDKPTVYSQTANYRNTTTFCLAYQRGTLTPDTFNVSCGVPANQYFWLNSLHPTSPIHDLMAAKIAELLL